MSETAPIAELESVTFGYVGAPVVEGVSLTVESGDFLGLVGPNGSGKSTLLKLLLGLLTPDRGTATLFGAPAHACDCGERLGYVAQDVARAATSMPVTVREVVRMGRYAHTPFGRFGDADHAAVDEALATVAVDDLADRRIAHLSGGQRQRVFIARALAAEADLLALDEPAVGVDVESRESFYGLLRDLNRDGMTIVLVEHDLGVVTEYATTVACINRELYFHGDSDGFAESDALERAYGANQRVLSHNHG